MKTLLIVFHTHRSKTAEMADAVARGARRALVEAGAEDELRVIVKRCHEAGAQDLLESDALILGTPENFGYMSGMMKDFLERVFYPCEGRVEGRPYATFVAAGQDGRGAMTSIERVVAGLRLRKAHAGVVGLGELTPDVRANCEDLGAIFAAGLALGAL
ncbi:MAG: NAD(P)H-dependent oxidoreductase [Betaproteobacteria bacterium]|nr:NAD(P)H-dependent oxidoreductase [Betaproteobacteria bacterium]